MEQTTSQSSSQAPQNDSQEVLVKKDFFSWFSPRVQLGITVVGVLAALLTLWLAANIAPLVQDIALVKAQVEDLKDNVEDIKQDTLTRNEWQTRNAFVDT